MFFNFALYNKLFLALATEVIIQVEIGTWKTADNHNLKQNFYLGSDYESKMLNALDIVINFLQHLKSWIESFWKIRFCKKFCVQKITFFTYFAQYEHELLSFAWFLKQKQSIWNKLKFELQKESSDFGITSHNSSDFEFKNIHCVRTFGLLFVKFSPS